MTPKEINIDGVAYILTPKLEEAPTRTPLFTTTDGKPVYKGDIYVKVNDYSDYSIVSGFVAESANNIYEGQKFLTKEAAEEWIAYNKPMYSLADIQKALHGKWGTQNAVDNVLHRIKNSKNGKV